jgi:D-glycero-D-manno-heptose 1,7-bisphosphate phosphatase
MLEAGCSLSEGVPVDVRREQQPECEDGGCFLNRVFAALDRDGTLIRHVPYLVDLDQVELLPGAAEGVRSLNRRGVPVVIVTNQSVVGRGLIDEAGLAVVHLHLRHLLEVEDAKVDAILYCPHLPEDQCACRKPKTLMLQEAARLADSLPTCAVVVGDSVVDMALARVAGARAIHVQSGVHSRLPAGWGPVPSVSGLQEAASLIIGWVDAG